MTDKRIRISFSTVDCPTLLADDTAVVEDWDYAPNYHPWGVDSDGIVKPYVETALSLGADERGQGLPNFSIYLMNVTPYGYSFLRHDTSRWGGKRVKRGTVFIPNADAQIDAGLGFTQDGLDSQWVCYQCEMRFPDVSKELLRRRANYDGPRFLMLDIQCFNGLYQPSE